MVKSTKGFFESLSKLRVAPLYCHDCELVCDKIQLDLLGMTCFSGTVLGRFDYSVFL